MGRFAIIAVLLLIPLIIMGCEPQATPVPVDIPPTETPIPVPTEIPTIRYALASNTLDFVADIDTLRGYAVIEQLTEAVNPEDLGIRYDIVVSYGELTGWTATPESINVSLVFAPDMPQDIKLIIQQIINPQGVISVLGMPGAIANFTNTGEPSDIRVQMANTGRPDGFSVVLAHAFTPGISIISNQLSEIGIDTQSVQLTNQDILAGIENHDIEFALMIWLTPENRQTWADRFGDTNVIDLYSLPISYRAVPDLQITISENGFPLPSW